MLDLGPLGSSEQAIGILHKKMGGIFFGWNFP